MNRADLQQLADERVADASSLLRTGQWFGAYCVVGYAVECALKSCIAKLVNLHDFPDKELANRSFTHEIEVLVRVAGLAPARDTDARLNPLLGQNWLIVKRWNERARYGRWTESEARELFLAVTDPVSGVLPWIKFRW